MKVGAEHTDGAYTLMEDHLKSGSIEFFVHDAWVTAEAGTCAHVPPDLAELATMTDADFDDAEADGSVDSEVGPGAAGSCSQVGIVHETSQMSSPGKHRIYTTSVASVYPHYVAKAGKKGRTKAEVDEIIRWLTGYSQPALEGLLERRTDFETFFAEAPCLNPARTLVRGVICGVRIEEIAEPTMREIRYLDKLIDELARGKAMAKILRSAPL